MSGITNHGALLGATIVSRSGRYRDAAERLLRSLLRATNSDPSWPAVLLEHSASAGVPGFSGQDPDVEIACGACAGEDAACERCGGRGLVAVAAREYCPECRGLGLGLDSVGRPCEGCAGQGTVARRP